MMQASSTESCLLNFGKQLRLVRRRRVAIIIFRVVVQVRICGLVCWSGLFLRHLLHAYGLDVSEVEAIDAGHQVNKKLRPRLGGGEVRQADLLPRWNGFRDFRELSEKGVNDLFALWHRFVTSDDEPTVGN